MKKPDWNLIKEPGLRLVLVALNLVFCSFFVKEIQKYFFNRDGANKIEHKVNSQKDALHKWKEFLKASNMLLGNALNDMFLDEIAKASFSVHNTCHYEASRAHVVDSRNMSKALGEDKSTDGMVATCYIASRQYILDFMSGSKLFKVEKYKDGWILAPLVGLEFLRTEKDITAELNEIDKNKDGFINISEKPELKEMLQVASVKKWSGGYKNLVSIEIKKYTNEHFMGGVFKMSGMQIIGDKAFSSISELDAKPRTASSMILYSPIFKTEDEAYFGWKVPQDFKKFTYLWKANDDKGSVGRLFLIHNGDKVFGYTKPDGISFPLYFKGTIKNNHIKVSGSVQAEGSFSTLFQEFDLTDEIFGTTTLIGTKIGAIQNTWKAKKL